MILMNITSRTAHRYALGFLLACILTCATLTADAAVASPVHARPVSLSDARYAPDYLSNLGAGASLTITAQCPRGGHWNDVSAYTWRGGALSGQRWTDDGILSYWLPRAEHGRPGTYFGRVTFDGITFRNTTRAAVIVAGWCG